MSSESDTENVAEDEDESKLYRCKLKKHKPDQPLSVGTLLDLSMSDINNGEIIADKWCTVSCEFNSYAKLERTQSDSGILWEINAVVSYAFLSVIYDMGTAESRDREEKENAQIPSGYVYYVTDKSYGPTLYVSMVVSLSLWTSIPVNR